MQQAYQDDRILFIFRYASVPNTSRLATTPS
ncbi:MAG: Unknown protein, partial [uncultured Thiotrichaceae bacterium]